MSNLLSLDLTSALRVAVEQSMPQMRSNALLGSLQVPTKTSSSAVQPASSNKDTETQKDLEFSGADVFSLLSGGVATDSASMANFDLAYTSDAKMVSGSEMGFTSTFLIVA